MRYTKELSAVAPIFNVIPDNTTLVITGEKYPGGQGISNVQLVYEGVYELADYPGESWGHKAPEGTVFTARGNLQSFFLKEDKTALMVENRYPEDTVENLVCTDQLETVRKMIEVVKTYR